MITAEKIAAAKTEFDALYRSGVWSSAIDARMGLLGRKLYRLRMRLRRETATA